MKGKWIYWRWKDAKTNPHTVSTFFHSYVQEIIPTDKGNLLELNDSEVHSNYPNRTLENEIEILKDKP